MTEDVTVEHVAKITEAEELWQLLNAAKQRNDSRLVRAVELRMRDIAGARRFAHLSDAQLAAQIKGLARNRVPRTCSPIARLTARVWKVRPTLPPSTDRSGPTSGSVSKRPWALCSTSGAAAGATQQVGLSESMPLGRKMSDSA